MTRRSSITVLAVALAALLVLSAVAVSPAAAGGEEHEGDDHHEDDPHDDGDKGDDGDDSDDGDDHHEDDGSTGDGDGAEYHLQQGDRCIPMDPLQNGESAESFYDWGEQETSYSSAGTTDLQRDDTSILFLYEAPDGTMSLVVVHERLDNEGSDGGAVSFTFSGMPSDGSWTVQDDNYDGDNNFDGWDTSGTTHNIDWVYSDARTDGGVFTGLGDDVSVQVDPAFNEEAALYEDPYEGDVTSWQALSGDRDSPDRTSLSMDQPITIHSGPCETDDGKDDGSGDSDESSASPSIDVTHSAVNESEVTAGEPIEVEATVTNDGDAHGEYSTSLQVSTSLVERESVSLGPGESTTLTFVTTIDDIGSQAVMLGNSLVERVEVTPEPDPDASASADENGTVEVDVSHADAGSSVGTDVSTTNDSDVSIDHVDVTVAEETEQLTVTADTQASTNDSDATAVNATGLSVVDYVEMSHDADEETFANATVEFTVAESALADDVDADEVVLLHYNDSAGEWEEVETQLVAETDDGYRFNATLDEFSTFAVGQQQAAFETESSVDSTDVTAGEDVTVTATVANNGQATGTTSVPLVVDGEEVATEDVELEPGEETSVTFTHTFDAEGEHSLAAGKESGESVQVAAQETATETDEEADEAEPTATDAGGDEPTEGDGPGFGIALALGALVAGGVVRLVRE